MHFTPVFNYHCRVLHRVHATYVKTPPTPTDTHIHTHTHHPRLTGTPPSTPQLSFKPHFRFLHGGFKTDHCGSALLYLIDLMWCLCLLHTHGQTQALLRKSTWTLAVHLCFQCLKKSPWVNALNFFFLKIYVIFGYAFNTENDLLIYTLALIQTRYTQGWTSEEVEIN